MTAIYGMSAAWDRILCVDLLEKLVAAGFTLRTFAAYERHLGIARENYVALLEPTPDGRWRRFSAGGYLLDGQIALLFERGGQKFFVHKSKQLPATGEGLAQYERFLRDLDAILQSQ